MKKTDAVSTLLTHTSAMTSTTNTPGTWSGTWVGVIVHVNVTAVSGTSPTLNIKVQDSGDGLSWYDVPSGALPQITAVGQQRFVIAGPVGNMVRAVCTIGGTTPSFSADIWFTGTN